MTTLPARTAPAGGVHEDWLSDAAWRDDAACRDADPELFFPDGDARSARAQAKTAKLICRGCPVSVTCLTWALDSGQEAGIWGGLTEDERHRMRRRRRGLRQAPYPVSEETP